MIKPENYYVVHGWMITDLKLSGIALQVYAIIYGFSQDDKSVYNGGQQYLMDWTGCERNTVKSALKKLLDDGLVECIQGKVHGRDGYLYRTLSKFDSIKNQQCQKLTETVSKIDSVPLSKIDSVPCQKLHPSSSSPSYSPADLPPAPYNNIKKDIRKEKKEDGDATPAPATFSSSPKRKSFSLAPEGDEIPELDIPCENGITMYFTDGDIQDLKRGYVGVNVVAEIRKMQLQAKQVGKIYSLDRTRRRVHPWLQNVQNTLGANSQVPTKVYTTDPADPANKPKQKQKPTHEEFLASLSPEDRKLYLDAFAEAKRDHSEHTAPTAPISDRFRNFLTRTANSLDDLQRRKEAANDR